MRDEAGYLVTGPDLLLCNGLRAGRSDTSSSIHASRAPRISRSTGAAPRPANGRSWRRKTRQTAPRRSALRYRITGMAQSRNGA